jgi:hypothetical protein
MPTITPNQPFKHGVRTYESGEKYEVSDEDAEYFKGAGWVGERAAGEGATLEVDNLQLGHSAEVN